ncbi:M56 family metallopeptidase [Polaribacter sp. SA4-12]|uniref:M56 family metallopeptidase n=1 Tax=Polaribacter sp. SA4-12 TaxID=1312072 RepID=UPI000B3C3033|nr:M56 family metallopeptidase [Polaribacter sp. SA4-12]ARV16187.1 hypothetical protein BTO07_13995 [Polaribacter sp. SA4-12]
MVLYLLKSAGCLALLLAFYHLVLEREKMHKFNRFYLLGSVLFSFLVPAFVIYIEAIPKIITSTHSISYSTLETPVEKSINYTLIFTSIYFIISSVFTFRFGKNLFKIINKIKRNQHQKLDYATLVLVDDKILPHSFLNYIFINKEEYISDKIEPELITHELTHVNQKHTIDVLIVEFLYILFWINPLFIILKKAIQLNHEFLADNKVIATYKNTSQYQHLLLGKAAWNNEYYLASNLNYSLTKKRLTMMTTKSSNSKILIKKLAIIPLLAGFIFLFAKRVEAKNDNSISISDLKISEINKDTIPSNVEIKYEKLSATKSEVREYKKLLAKGKKAKIFKQKDVLKLQYLYKVMSEKQKNSVENVFDVIPPPPPPVKENNKEIKFATSLPPSVSPIVHIIKMAKKDAIFIFEAKEITSDKAIELLKKNKDLNIETRSENLKNPIVKIFKKGITVRRIDTGKKVKPTYYIDGKIVSEKEMKTLTPDKIKSINVKKNKDGSGSIYITSKKTITIKEIDTKQKKEPTYYLDGKIISKEEMENFNFENIKNVNVKKNKDGSGSVYITSKKE